MRSVKFFQNLIIVVLFSLIILPNYGWADSKPVVTLEQAKKMARQGPDNQLIEINYLKANENVLATKNDLGIGAANSKTMQMSIDNIDLLILEWENAISVLESNIEQWENQLDTVEDVEKTQFINSITEAQEQINHYKYEINDARKERANIFVSQQTYKTIEDNVKSVLDPVQAGADAASDAKQTQPRVIDYKVEEVYFSLLLLEEQLQYQKKTIENLKKDMKIEEIKLDLGMSSLIIINQYEENLRKVEDGLRSTQSIIDNTSRAFKRMLGLPIDFEFRISQANVSSNFDYLVEESSMPDFKTTLRYIRAVDNVEKKLDELDDFPVYNRNEEKYRIAELSLKEAEIQLEQTLISLESNYKASLDNLQLTDKVLNNAYLNLEIARDRYTTAKLQYDLGLISLVELEKIELTLQEAKLNLIKAQQDKHLAYLAYLLARDGIEV